MNPLYLFPIALIVPVIVAMVAFIPTYASIFGAVYYIYDRPEAANPLVPYKFDVFYIFDVYTKLFEHWSAHMGTSNFVDFTLPLIGLPLVGTLISLYLTYKFGSMMVNFFRMASVN